MKYVCKHCKNEVTHIIDLAKHTEIYVCFHCGRRFERPYKDIEHVYEVDFDNKTIRSSKKESPLFIEVSNE